MHVYVIKDETGLFYTGITDNLDRRLKEHRSLKERSTKHGKNWQLVFCQECKDRKEARQFEKQLKSGSFRENRKHLFR